LLPDIGSSSQKVPVELGGVIKHARRGRGAVLPPQTALPPLRAPGRLQRRHTAFKRNRDKVAEVSKAMVSGSRTYGVEVVPAQEDALILACTVCIDYDQ
jgi:hypothetical protein